MIGLYSANSQAIGGGGFTGLLDEYGGAAAAYSVRRLSSSYIGSLIEVRRSSDNTTQNIGYDANGDLDTTALLSFVGAGDGFVRTWYDQSGNAYNATQTTTTAQPQIVNSGSLILENGKTTVDFSGGNWELEADAVALEFAGTNVQNNYYSVITSAGSVDKFAYAMAASSGNTVVTNVRTSGLNNLRVQFRDDFNKSNNAETGTSIFNQSLVSVQGTPSDFDVFIDGSIISNYTSSLGLISLAKFTIGNDARPLSLFWGGNIQEIILYNSDKSANRTGIEENINTYYTIY